MKIKELQTQISLGEDSTSRFHADELPTWAGNDQLDKLRFQDFLRNVYQQAYPDDPEELMRLLRNMNLATDDGVLNLAGLLMFAERPQLIKPQFVVKAIPYPGDQVHVTDYVDTKDFAGPLPKIFEDALAFVMRNLHKIQAGRGVNAPGRPEIPESVFEELLVNALVHRDYLVSAPVRLFVYDNRIEIISPGHLPDNLAVEKIRTGNANIRNPILVSYVAKGLLPYHGLGSGIKRALAEWPQIDLADDRDGCLFTAMVHRKPAEELELVNISSDSGLIPDMTSGKRLENVGKTSRMILDACREKSSVTIPELAVLIGITERSVQRNIQKLQKGGLLCRVGGRKEGHREVLS